MDPTLHLPQFAQNPYGLWVPTQIFDGPRGPAPMPLFPSPTGSDLLVASRQRLDPFEYVMRVIPSESDLGLPVTSLGELIQRISRLPFEWAVVQLARVARELYGQRTAEQQLAYARVLFDNARIVDAMEDFLRSNERALLFSDQHLFILLRLVVEHAAAGPDRDATDDELLSLKRCFVAAASVALEPMRMAANGEDMDRETAVAWLTQNGGYHGAGDMLSDFVRGDAILGQALAGARDGLNDNNPLAEWLTDDYGGLDARGQFAAGFAIAATTACFDDVANADRVMFPPERIRESFDHLGVAPDVALGAISATREQFVQTFAARDGFRDGVYWDRRPFLDRPLLRREDGTYVLLHSKALLHWLSYAGVKRRVTLSGERRGRKISASVRRQWGRKVEAYAVRRAREAFPTIGGRDRVAEDHEYLRRTGHSRTPDICVDEGADLVVFEVVSGDLSEASRVDADPRKMRTQIEQLVTRKVRQLDRRLSDFFAGLWTVFGVPEDRWVRIWPVLVTSGDLLQHELLWDHIDRETPGCLQQPRVQPLQLLDLEDFEMLLGFAEHGTAMSEVLRRKTGSPFRRLELSAWATDAPMAPPIRRMRTVEAEMDAVFVDAAERLGFDISATLASRQEG